MTDIPMPFFTYGPADIGVIGQMGLPTVKVGETVTEQLQAELETEKEAITRLTAGIEKCRRTDEGTRLLLEEILHERAWSTLMRGSSGLAQGYIDRLWTTGDPVAVAEAVSTGLRGASPRSNAGRRDSPTPPALPWSSPRRDR